MSTNSATSAPNTTQRIGGYEILRLLDSGGVAEVYLARQPSLDRAVAIKVLSAAVMNDPDIAHRFDQEALTIARLNHPNIIHIIDRGVDSGRYYFVMDFVDGYDLRSLISTQTLTVEQKCDIVIQVLKALDYAHKNGVIHLDMQPTNILIDRQLNVLVSDFGMAQMAERVPGDQQNGKTAVGSPAYMAPEQKTPHARAQQTADIYSMGVVLYEILTGEKPQGDFRPASAYSKEIPAELDAVISRALAESPAERYQTAVEFKDAILTALSHTTGGLITADDTLRQQAEDVAGKCVYLDTIKEHPYGATYLVENPETQELFVIKKIFHREPGLKVASNIAQLKHPNILSLFEVGNDGTQAILLMEYARGGSLAERLVRKMPWKQVVGILDDCVQGLTYAHKNNIHHGNLRPSNVLLNNEGVAMLADFGLPEHYAQDRTDWYGAPETRRGVQSDIYSLGVIAYRLLTNQLPLFDEEGHLRPFDDVARVPEKLQNILGKMLDREPARRYKSFGEIAGALSGFVRVQSNPIPRMHEMKRRRRTYRLGWTGWLIGFCSGLVAAALLAYLLGFLDPWLPSLR